MRLAPLLISVAAASAAMWWGCACPVSGDEINESSTPIPRLAPPPPPAVAGPVVEFKVYEWGVATQHWSGGADARFDGDVPAAYYDESEVPIEAEIPPVPDPVDPPDPPDIPDAPRKPVVYFDCAQGVTFDIDVIFKSGKVTWMYPKPTRRTGEAVAQWDNVALKPDTDKERAAKAKPALLDVPAAHWANYSREGSTSDLIVNGQYERFLFYEGRQASLCDLDICKNDKGEFVLSNYSAWPIHDFGAVLKLADGDRARFVAVPEIPAASGDTPGEVVIKIRHVAEAKKGMLGAQCEAAGLTAAQGKVFDRCWYDEFMATSDDRADHCYWYRRDQAALDSLVELKLTLPEGYTPTIKRAGYVYVHGVDYAKCADFDKAVTSALGGDKDAREKVSKGGLAAVGALRRALADKELALKKRIELAQLLKTIMAKWPQKGA